MTWDELKAEVEAALSAAGKTGSVEIDYMDFNGASSTVEAYVVEEFTIAGKSLGWTLTVQ